MDPSRALLLAGLTLACPHEGRFANGIYENSEVRFRVGALPSGFSLMKLKGASLAFYNKAQAATIAVNATCGEADDVPLSALRDHLLFGFTERTARADEILALDGREALLSRVTGKLDGVPVRLTLVVLKKDGCVFDFAYSSPPSRHDTVAPAFLDLVRGFSKLPLGGAARGR